MFRAPSEPSLLPNATIAEFASFVGLQLDSEGDRVVLDEMKREARQGYYRLCADRASLLPYLQMDDSIRPPFAATQITEGALQQEIDRTYALAASITRPVYDQGVPTANGHAGNWVVRWLLWHMLLHGVQEEERTQQTQYTRRDLAQRSVRSEDNSQNDATAARTYWDPARNT